MWRKLKNCLTRVFTETYQDLPVYEDDFPELRNTSVTPPGCISPPPSNQPELTDDSSGSESDNAPEGSRSQEIHRPTKFISPPLSNQPELTDDRSSSESDNAPEGSRSHEFHRPTKCISPPPYLIDRGQILIRKRSLESDNAPEGSRSQESHRPTESKRVRLSADNSQYDSKYGDNGGSSYVPWTDHDSDSLFKTAREVAASASIAATSTETPVKSPQKELFICLDPKANPKPCREGSNVSEVQCVYCGKSFDDYHVHQSHYRSCPKKDSRVMLVCPMCKKVLHRNGYSSHIRHTHFKPRTRTPPNTAKLSFVCHICNTKLRSPQMLFTHLAYIH